MNRAKAAVLLSFLLIALLVGLTLRRSPARVVSARSTGNLRLLSTVGDATGCQGGEVLPADVTAVRVGLQSAAGPPVHLRILAGSRVLAMGRRGGGWSGDSLTFAVKPLKHPHTDVRICFAIGPNSELVRILGQGTSEREGLVWTPRQQVAGKAGVEYLQPGRSTWWSLALTVARHMGLGHVVTGTWIALLIAVLTAAVGALATGALLRELP